MSLELQHVFGNMLSDKSLKTAIIPFLEEEFKGTDFPGKGTPEDPTHMSYAYPCGGQLFKVQIPFPPNMERSCNAIRHSYPEPLVPYGISNYQEISCITYNESLIAVGMRGECADILLLEKSSEPGHLPLRCKFEEHDHDVTAMSFTENGSNIVSIGGAKDQRVFVWSSSYGSEGEIIASISLKSVASQFTHEITQLANLGYVRDIKGRDTRIFQISSCSNSGIVLWDIDDHARTISPHSISTSGKQIRAYECIVAGYNNTILYAGTTSSDIAIVLMKTRVIQEYVPCLASGGVLSLVFISGNVPLLCSGHGDGSVSVFKATRQNLTAVAHLDVDAKSAITSMCWLNSDRCTGGCNTNETEDCISRENVKCISERPVLLSGHSNGSIHYVILPLDCDSPKDGNIRPSDRHPSSSLQKESEKTVLKGVVSLHTVSAVNGVAYPDCGNVSEKFAVCSQNGEACAFSVEDSYSLTGRMSARSTPGSEVTAATSISWISSIDVVVVGHEDSKLRLWAVNTPTPELLSTIEQATRKKAVCSLIAIESPNKENTRSKAGPLTPQLRLQSSIRARASVHPFAVVGGYEGEIRLWDLKNNSMYAHMKEHTMSVNSMSTLREDMLVSGSRDRTLLTWDIRTCKRVTCHREKQGGINCLVANDDGLIITGCKEKHITYWDVKRSPTPVHLCSTGDDEPLCLARNGNILASGGTNCIVKLWDVRMGTELGSTGVGHTNHIKGVAFAPDGRQLTSVSNDCGVHLWNVFPSE